MSKRLKKTDPPDTFIPTPQRVMAILQLCIAFSLLAWYIFQPFMGEYFAVRSRMLIYEYVMGTSPTLNQRSHMAEKLEKHESLFELLPIKEKNQIVDDYRDLKNYLNRPVSQKIFDGFHVVLFKIPPFELAWIVFSIIIAVKLLKKAEGSKGAAWLLPLIVLAYCTDNQLTGKASYVSADTSLFPTEKVIIDRYIDRPIAPHSNQQQQLKKGWENYLRANWGNQIEKAEFKFTIARLKLLHHEQPAFWLNRFHDKLWWPTLFFYLLWNCLFAIVCNLQNKRNRLKIA